MNEAGPITDLAACEDAIRTAVQKCSFSQRIQKFVDFYLADGERGPTGTRNCSISLFSNTVRMASNGGLIAAQRATRRAA